MEKALEQREPSLPGLSRREQLEIIKVEKNLNSLGFFTPTHKGLDARKSKTITITREERGRRIQARATIFPSPDHGLPTTADQDKYFAFQKIVTDLKKKTGQVSNPIGFTTYQLLKILGINASGKNYEEISQWLERMTLTGIRSENMVYFAGRKVFAKDVFHVFERVVQVGQQMPDGRNADQNYVWLSEWQLENLNSNYVLPVDLHSYRQLRSSIAKALVPLLQIWFYASQRRPVEKRYGELCQQLNIRRWPHLSKIKENFAPAVDELKALEFLEDWSVQRTADKTDFKLILIAGARFGKEPRTDRALFYNPRFDSMLKLMVERGVREDRARHVLLNVPEDQAVEDQIEWGDHLIASAPRGKFFNPAGFYVYLIQDNIQPPPTFESSRKRAERQQAAAARTVEQHREGQWESAYRDYEDRALVDYLHHRYPNLEEELASVRAALLAEFDSAQLWPEETRREVALQLLKKRVRGQAPVLSFDEFCRQAKLFSS